MESSNNLYFGVVIVTKWEYILPTTVSKFSLGISSYMKFSLTFYLPGCLSCLLSFSEFHGFLLFYTCGIIFSGLICLSLLHSEFLHSLLLIFVFMHIDPHCVYWAPVICQQLYQMLSLAIRPTQSLPSRSCSI